MAKLRAGSIHDLLSAPGLVDVLNGLRVALI